MVLGHAIRHPQTIVAIADLATNVDGPHNAEAERKTIEVGIQPKAEEYSSSVREPPSLPDCPDVEGSLWKESVALAHLTPQERENVV
jgi:hypothetical protein